MADKTPQSPLINLFTPHYFHGEYELPQLIRQYCPENEHSYCGRVELEPETWEKTINWQHGLDPDNMDHDSKRKALWEKFLSDLYPGITPEYISPYAQTIISIEFHDNPENRKQIAHNLIGIAEDIEDNTGGYDDTEDYAPDTILAIACLVGQLGFPEDEANLIDIAKGLQGRD